jgi:peptidoglycan/LPS O-acetylase OafA/YrhL
VGSATSNFPLLPWAAYFFWGILLRELLGALPRMRPALVTAGAGLLLTLLLAWISTRTGYGGRQVFFWRLALMLLVAAVILALPESLARRLAPLGRASLWAYMLHLPIAYGWSTVPGLAWWLGRSLSAPVALVVALCVVAVTVPASLWAKRHVSPRKKRLWDWLLSRLPRAQVPDSPLFTPDADARSRT